MHEVCRHLLLPNCPDYLLNVAQLIQIGPGEGAQRFHRDSHRWEPERKPEPHEITQATMDAGSAVYYLGKTLHGGGANSTAHQPLRALFYCYVVGWLRTGENMFLTVPIDKVRHLPTRVQELLGYKSLGGIGIVDVGSPMLGLQ